MNTERNINKGQNSSMVPPVVQGSISDPLSPHQVSAKAEVVAEIDGGHAHQVHEIGGVKIHTASSHLEDVPIGSNALSPHQVAAKREVVAEIEGHPVIGGSATVVTADRTAEDSGITLAAKVGAIAAAVQDSVVGVAVAAKEAVQNAGAVVSERVQSALPVVQEKAVAAGHVVQEKAVAAGTVVQEKTAAAIPVIQERAAAAGAVLQQSAVAAKDYVAETGATAGAVMQERAVAARDSISEAAATAGAVISQQAKNAGAVVQERAIAAKEASIDAAAIVQEKARNAGAVVQERAVAAKDYVADSLPLVQEKAVAAGAAVQERAVAAGAAAGAVIQGETKQSTVNLQLANGIQMPALGFGCAFGNWTDKSAGFFGFKPDDGWHAIPTAVRAGFRAFDCALVYGTHKILGISLGAEFAKGTIKREDVFVTTKVCHPYTEITLNRMGRSFDYSLELGQIKERVLHDLEKSLDELNLGYVDLLLMHWPGKFDTTDVQRGRAVRKEVWSAFEEIYKSGRARAIGVSNFLVRHLEGLREDGITVTPMVNQIEVNPFIRQQEVVTYCQAHNILVSAWAPFGSGDNTLLSNPVLTNLASKYGKNVGQIILRWLYQKGISSLPKSTNEGRMQSNLQIFNFTLDSADVLAIDGLDKHQTCVATSDSIA